MYTLILVFYVITQGSTQVTETTLAERHRDRAACLEAGKTLEYVDARNAPDIRVGYVCIATGRFK
jgi:hypothetical protein